MPGYLSVKGFEKFQHYKDRNPPWIKLYNELLDDYEFGLLPDEAKWHLVAIWLLASRYSNRIPADAAWIAKRINATRLVNLWLLVKTGFLVADQDCSELLAACKQSALLETEREGETETERTLSDSPAANADVVQLKTKSQKHAEAASEVLHFLNNQTGHHYRPVAGTLKPIVARLAEGYTVGEMRAVIVRRKKKWAGDPKMAEFLRPKTLFAAENFAQYVGEVPPAQTDEAPHAA